MNDETLDLEEAAKFLHMSASALRQKTKSGEVRGAKPAKCWVYLKQDLVDHIRSKYTDSVEIPFCGSQKMEIQKWQFTNAEKNIGSVSQHQMESEYAVQLGLETKSKHKSTTTN